jgi:hypothetical protein
MKENNKLSELIGSLFCLKPILPGKITKQYRSCGNPNCHCMKDKEPQKHPYFQFTYSLGGKKSTVYVKKSELEIAEEMTSSYKELRKNLTAISLETVDLIRKHGIKKVHELTLSVIEKQLCKAAGIRAKSKSLKDTERSRDSWKTKAIERKAELNKQKVTIRDLTASREKWRKLALSERKAKQALEMKLINQKNKSLIVAENHSSLDKKK